MQFGLKDQKSYPLTSTFRRGRNSFYRGDTYCPFAWNTSNAREWQRGFDNAYFEHLRKGGK